MDAAGHLPEVADCKCALLGPHVCEIHGRVVGGVFTHAGCKRLRLTGSCGHRRVPGAPCPHVLAADHGESVAEWALRQWARPAHGPWDDYGELHIDTDPTDALPGTAEKLAVMERRVAAGLAPFHPGDARVQGV